MKRQRQRGDWFLTFTGKRFYPLDPRPTDICIEDIAHALAQICRFGGHCQEFYSVAQHSVLVSCICTQTPKQGLMHDATEAYVGDVVRPLKYALATYLEIEERVWFAVAKRFKLAPKLHPEVKRADNTVLMTERRDLLVHNGYKWSLEDEFPPMHAKVIPLSQYRAERDFLKRYTELFGS